MNPLQLCTITMARALAGRLSSGAEGPKVGGGIMPEVADSSVSGIYMDQWFNAGGPEHRSVDPATGEIMYPILFRFRNGASGMNAGLIADRFRRYPNSPRRVLEVLAEEADMLAAGVK